MPNQPPARRFRFGVFEADTATGELRKSGVRLRLRDQPFQVLVVLLERPGELITREELRQKLWPDGTFVDFDHSLNSVINKLREVLSDSAANPRFIETLARRGYRFLVPVELLTNGTPSAEVNITDAPTPAAEGDASLSMLFTSAQDLPPVPHGYVRILFLLIQIMYLSFYIAALARLSAVQDILEEVFRLPAWTHVALVVSATIGIPIRLYLLSYVGFNVENLVSKFRNLFVLVFLLDEFWALAPFLLVRQLGWGLALGATAALIYVPFAERTLVLMRARTPES